METKQLLVLVIASIMTIGVVPFAWAETPKSNMAAHQSEVKITDPNQITQVGETAYLYGLQ